MAGIKLVLMDRWDAAEAIKLIREHGATFTVGATPFLAELVAELERTGIDLPLFRLFASGGAPVPPEIVYRAARVLRNGVVCRIFGSSEAPTVTLGILRREDQELGATTDGRIVNHEVRICDPVSGAVLPAGVEGEIVTRGPEVMVGYTDWSQTEEAFDADGYFRMGDLGYISHGDFITVSGRKKDLIIRGGENLSPKEIEDVLHAHPAVREAAVVAMPHARLGETPCAFVVLNEDHAFDLAEMRTCLDAAGLARQKFPERIVVVPELPKTAAGKVLKHVLRERAKGSAAGG